MESCRKRGFTIVEMLMVIGILGVLIGIVTTASGTAIRQARAKRTQAMMAVLQAGLDTYYTQKGRWPGKIDQWSDNGPTSAYAKKYDVDYLSDEEADGVFQELVQQSVRSSPMLDVSGLFVMRASSVKTTSGAKQYGMDFRKAVSASGKGSEKHEQLKPSQMAFGYSEKKSGYFRRYVIRYNFKTDTVSVMTQNEGSASTSDYYTETGKTWPNRPVDK